MIAHLKPYPKMKDSGVPWLGWVPAHWETERAKWLFRKMNRPVRDSDEVVTCFRDGTVTLRKNRRVRGFTESLKEIGYQGIRRGDLVIHAMDAFAGAIGVADADGKGTPVYSVCEPRPMADSRYYAYAVREMARSQWIQALAKGIRERSTDFRFEGFGSQSVPLPPLPEQAAIVRFLDHTDRRIRRYIRAKQKLIKLLEERKQAIIHRAVTRGLDPNVRLKPSGVEWLGDVPEHWEVLTLRRVVTRAVDGPHHSPRYLDSGIPFLSARNIKADRWSLGDAKYISEADYAEFSKRVVPEIGDVLYTKGGTTGVARAVDLHFRFQVWVHVAVLKVKTYKVLPEYLALVLNSPRCYEQAQLFTRGATNQDLGLGRMKGIVLALPRPSEQEALLGALEERTRGLNDAAEKARREIELLREYRNRLIADVVTGKLDVREAAARLPQEAEDLEPLDEADVEGDADEADARDTDDVPEESEA
jgi:type I restriction enzyme S subunit